MTEHIRIFAGECTTEFEGKRDRTQRGRVVVVVKPDRTVLVHDATGYQPVAWLTRADDVTVEADREGFGVTARAGDQTLRVTSHAGATTTEHPVTDAGVPVGTCPECGETLVRDGHDVSCLGCGDAYRLPAGATVLDSTCPDCGLPRIRADRGDTFEVCLDYACDSLDDRVRDRFDREWTCPECGDDLRIVRVGGRLLAGCDAHPDCDAAFSIPPGVVAGECDCGLPVFETPTDRRCLDATCDIEG